jgi:hypothetical protein
MHAPRPHEDSLRRLGIEEVKERLELSNLALGAGELQNPDIETCCCCKINDPLPDPEDAPPDSDDPA